LAAVLRDDPSARRALRSSASDRGLGGLLLDASTTSDASGERADRMRDEVDEHVAIDVVTWCFGVIDDDASA